MSKLIDVTNEVQHIIFGSICFRFSWSTKTTLCYVSIFDKSLQKSNQNCVFFSIYIATGVKSLCVF